MVITLLKSGLTGALVLFYSQVSATGHVEVIILYYSFVYITGHIF